MGRGSALALWLFENFRAPSPARFDLVGFAMWTIFFSLGFFTAWALVSWPLAIAPIVMLMEECSPFQAVGRSLRLGKTFIGKLVEINLVMGIVTLALPRRLPDFQAVMQDGRDDLGHRHLHAVPAS